MSETKTTPKYEYTTGYLVTDQARDINFVVGMMNQFGDDGWLFTGHAKDVLNGTFYMFMKEKDTTDAFEEIQRLRTMLNQLGFCSKDGEALPCTTCGAGL